MAIWARKLPPLTMDRGTASVAEPDTGRRRQLLWRLARTLQRFGVSAHRLERAVDVLARRLGVAGELVVTPTFIIGALDGEASVTRVRNEGTDLKRLTELHRLMRDVLTGELTVDGAEERLDAIEADEPRWSAWHAVVSYGLLAGSAAVLLEGGWTEVLLALSLGAVQGLLLSAARGRATVEILLPIGVGFVASFVSTAALSVISVQPLIPTLALLIPLLPGLTLTLAVSELAHQHLISGGARMAGALMTLLQLGFGVVLGNQLALELYAVGEVPAPAPLPAWAAVPALGLSVLLFAARNRALPRHLGFVLSAAVMSLVTGRATAAWLGPELGACLTAWLVASVGNVVSRRWDIPSVIFVLPGLLMLVPGVLGFRSLSSILQQDVLVGVQHGVAMLKIALALVMGLLLANLTSRPREIF
jgi:uncharacterized membrane protein YjjP (DUF1212 family)